jgi:hypothetical protein
VVADRPALPEEGPDPGVEAWRRRPYARTFDLISAEYGWTDDQILDLTIARLRQIRDVILERQGEDRRADLTVREVELRTTTQFIAAAAGSKQLVSQADKVRLLPPPTDATTGRVLRPNDRIGSYERMVGQFRHLEEGVG